MYYDNLDDLIDDISPIFDAVVPVHKSKVSKNTRSDAFFPYLGISGDTFGGKTIAFKHDSYTNLTYDNCTKFFGTFDYYNRDVAEKVLVRISEEQAELNLSTTSRHPFEDHVMNVDAFRDIATIIFDNIAFVKWHRIRAYGTEEKMNNWEELPKYDVLIGNRMVKEYAEFTRKTNEVSLVTFPEEHNVDVTVESLVAVYPGEHWICMLMGSLGKLKSEVFNTPFEDGI